MSRAYNFINTAKNSAYFLSSFQPVNWPRMMASGIVLGTSAYKLQKNEKDLEKSVQFFAKSEVCAALFGVASGIYNNTPSEMFGSMLWASVAGARAFSSPTQNKQTAFRFYTATAIQTASLTWQTWEALHKHDYLFATTTLSSIGLRAYEVISFINDR